MRSTTRWIHEVLDNRKTGWVLLLLAVACKSVLAAAFSSYEADKSFYLLLAENLGQGKGFTIPVTLLSNPGVTEHIYLPSAASPLYSIIAAPLLKLFPGNYFLVTWIIETLSWFFLFFVLRSLLLRLTKSHYWTNLYLLFAGFFLYSVELTSASKDVPALALLFLSLLLSVRISHPGQQAGIPALAGLALLYILPGLMKLTYLPLAFFFPVSLLLTGYLRKEKRLIRYGSIAAVFTVLLLAGHYFYFHSLESHTSSLYPDYYAKRWTMARSGNEYMAGFYPENLKVLYPFFPAALFNLDFAGSQIKHYLPAAHTMYGVLLYTLNFAGLALMIAGFFYLLRRYYRKPVSERIFFLLAGIVVSLALIGMLCMLSVRFKAIVYKGSSESWTFVYESRAFLFPLLFLQLCLVTFLFSQPSTAVITKWLRGVLLLLLAGGMIHGAGFVAKSAFRLVSGAERPASENRFMSGKADSLQKANPGYQVWLATELPHLDWYAKLRRQRVLNGLDHLNDDSFRLPPRTFLLTGLATVDTARIRSYLQTGNARELGRYGNEFVVYMQHP